MEQDIKVSVVVAAYNAERYIRQTISSLTQQTLKEIEIILVDDKSTDETYHIMQEYAARDPRIKVLQHLEDTPGGGAARNMGIAAARGEYLSILDGDDFFSPVMLEHAYARGRETDADVVIFDGDIYNDAEQKMEYCGWILKKKNLPEESVFSPKEHANQIFNLTIGSAWNLFPKRTYILEHQIKFENLHNTNDSLFAKLTMALAKKIAVLSEKLVFYRRNNMKSIYNNIAKHPLDGCEAMLSLKQELEKRGVFEQFQQGFLSQLYEFLFAYYIPTIRANDWNAYATLYGAIKTRYADAWGLGDLVEEDLVDPNFMKDCRTLLSCSTPEEYDVHIYPSNPKNIEPPPGTGILLYGGGNKARSFFQQVFRNRKWDIVGWMDRDYRQAGFPVSDPEECLKKSYDFVVIAAEDDLSAQNAKSYLTGLGVSPDQLMRSEYRPGGMLGTAVSVIVPVENGMPGISRTLNALLRQTMRNIEILVVDNDSSDGTREYVLQCQAEDHRVRLLTAKGMDMGACYNLGGLSAKGEYMAFCEPGDYFDYDMLEDLYRTAQNHNYPEIIKADYDRYLETDRGEFSIHFGVLPRNRRDLYGKEISFEQLPEFYVRDMNLWNGLYRSDFFRKHRISIPEGYGAIPQESLVSQAHLYAQREVYKERSSAHHQFTGSLFRRGAAKSALQNLANVLAVMRSKGDKVRDHVALVIHHMIRRCEFFIGIEGVQSLMSEGTWDEVVNCQAEASRVGGQLQEYLAELSYAEQERVLEDEATALLAGQPKLFLAQAEADMNLALAKQDHFIDLVKKYHKAVIFGAGERGRSLAAMLIHHDYHGEICFCDNNKSLVNTRMQGYRVMSPEKAAKDRQSVILLPIPSLDAVMRRQLLEAGADGERIIPGAEVWPVELVRSVGRSLERRRR